MAKKSIFVLAAYLAGTVGLGAWFSRSQRDVRDYFVSGHRVAKVVCVMADGRPSAKVGRRFRPNPRLELVR